MARVLWWWVALVLREDAVKTAQCRRPLSVLPLPLPRSKAQVVCARRLLM